MVYERVVSSVVWLGIWQKKREGKFVVEKVSKLFCCL